MATEGLEIAVKTLEQKKKKYKEEPETTIEDVLKRERDDWDEVDEGFYHYRNLKEFDSLVE